MKLASLLERARARLFGYDIFISYTRADAKDYAAKLHEQLTSLDYSCFIDRKEAPGGRSLNSSLVAALRGSQTLVLVATGRALGREYVRMEFGEFAATRRPIIPVNVDAALNAERLREEPWSVIRERDLIWIDETADALAHGLPSPEVYEGIQNLFQFTRRNVARRRWATSAAALILAAAGVAVWQAKVARAEKGRADEQRRIVETQTERLRETAGELQRSADDLRGRQSELVERNRQLQENSARLEAKTREAAENAEQARQQEALARQSAREAEAQQRLAVEQQRIAEAQLARNRHLLYGSDVRLAYSAYENRNMARAEELLDSHAPPPEQPRPADLRSFEWHHLRRLIPKKAQPLEGQAGYVTSAAFSPDGKVLARAGGGEIRLWDVGAKVERERLKVAAGHFLSVAFSPGGEYLAAVTPSGVRVWDARGLNPLTQLKAATSAYSSAAFSPDRKMLAVAGREGVSLWTVDGWRRLEPLPSPGVSVSFSPDSKTLAVGDQNGVTLWELSSREKSPARLEVQSGVTAAVAFSPDGRLFAAANRGGVKMWERSGPGTWEPREFQLAAKTGPGAILSLAFSPDSETLATGSTDRSARLWDATSGEEVGIPMRHDGYVWAVAFSPDGRALVTGGADRAAKIWDIGWRRDQVPLRHADIVWAVALSPDGGTLATGGEDSLVRMWDTSARRELGSFKAHAGRVVSVAFSPDGGTLATGGEDRLVRLWDATTRRPIESHALEGSVTSLAFSPDGRRLVACQQHGSPVLLDARTLRRLPDLKGDAKYAVSAAFAPDGVLATSGHSVKLWGRDAVRDLPVPRDVPTGPVAFAPDGKILAAVSGETILLWDVLAGELLGEMKGHTGSITSLAFTPDGRTLVTGGYDDSVRFWKPDTRQEISVRHVGSTVTSVALSGDGRLLSLGVFDRTARLWRAEGD